MSSLVTDCKKLRHPHFKYNPLFCLSSSGYKLSRCKVPDSSHSFLTQRSTSVIALFRKITRLNFCDCAVITEHQNFFGKDDRLGPVAISFRREEKEGSSGPQYNYRIIFRTTEVN